MPFTPFIGLSVLVHLLIIIGHKIFVHGSEVGVLIKRRTTQLRQIGTMSIIVSVFAVVILTASSLIRASVVDKHSSINISEKYIGIAAKMIIQGGNNLYINKTTMPAYASFIEKTATVQKEAPITAEICINRKPEDFNGSVVTYLKSKNTDYSFKARSYLAASYGIKNYYGSSPQNTLLLQKILTSECRS